MIQPLSFSCLRSSGDTSLTTTVSLWMKSLCLVALTASMASAATVVVEPLGACSRKTGFVITEIMYDPLGANTLEFIEIYNSNPFEEEIGDYRLSGEVDFTFPAGTILDGESYLIVAKDVTAFQAEYSLPVGVQLFEYGELDGSNSLSSSGTLRLVNSSNGRILEIDYDNDAPWPVAADGAGHSLVLARPSYGENDPQSWEASDLVGGSPGTGDTFGDAALRNVVINEVLAHTDDPQFDTIELYNHSNSSVDISGCILSDDAIINKFTIPASTILPARGYVIFDQNQMGFSLNTSGETIYFRNAAGTRMLDALKFRGQENGISIGRYPDGGPEFHRMASLSLGSANGARRLDDVVINEIMYDPISGESDEEFIELYNRSNGTVDLSGWRLRGGISYTFPDGVSISSGGYVVVARNAALLQANYAQLNASNTFGDFSGGLGNGGDNVRLDKPDTVTDNTDPQNPIVSTIHIVVDDVTYQTGGQWPVWANGGGSSLERVDARSNPRRPTAWADSDETGKATWTDVSVTGLLELGGDSAERIEGGLQGAGECLLDNVEVVSSSTNYVDNSTFDGGLSDWVTPGAYVRSSLSGNGYSGSCLHVRGSTRYDNGANQVSGSLSSTIANGSTATISAKAKWQKGYPWLYLRLHGNYLEAPVKLDVPVNLGTPGQVNSQAVANNAPAIDEVMHSPVVPSAGQAVVVSARIEDPDGVNLLSLYYRLDPSTSYSTVTMNDSGSSGDVIAGDGIYSATIPGQSSGALVAFLIVASDSAGSVSRLFPSNTPDNSARIRECLVGFGDDTRSSSFGTYRMWFTSAAITDWETRLALSNEHIEGTFVYNDNRVIYNFGAHYAGGTYKQGYGSPLNDSNYTMDMPLDDQLLGTDNFNKLHATGQNPFDDSFMTREQAVFEVARQLKQPWLYRRYVNVYINGVARKQGWLMEDTQVPGSEFIESYWPNDADGDLHKISHWFEFSDVATTTTVELNDRRKAQGQLTAQYNANGELHVPRYRWNWAPRSYGEKGSNDFTSVFELIEAANSGADMTEQMLAVADMEEWMRVWAARHASGDVDNFGRDLGQNFYAYKPTEGRWALLIWDPGHVFGNNASFLPGRGLFPDLKEPNGGDSTCKAVFDNPTFRRMYLRAYKEIANGAFSPSHMNNWLEVRYAAFVADGVTAADDPDTSFSHDDNNRGENYDGLNSQGGALSFTGSLKDWVADARAGILTQVAQQDVASFTLTSPTSVTSSGNTITITGSAPVEMATMTFNGVEYPLTWTSTTDWTIDFVVNESPVTIDLQGLDVYGEALSGMSATVTVTVTTSLDAPEDSIVINEILYNPTVAGDEFVELYNRSTTTAFDLTGWRVNGLGHTFSATIIEPGGILVIDNFSGKLDLDGETLTLYRPDGSGGEVEVDRVYYRVVDPWPTTPAGSSLQLADSAQDNRRVALWAVADGFATPPAGETLVDWGSTWKYNQSSGGLDGTGWETVSYDDTAWSSGPGAFGEESATLPHSIQTTLSAPGSGGPITTYFRKEINFTGEAGASLVLTTMVDDGLVVYVDGVPIHSLGLAAGTPTYTTTTNRTIDNAYEELSPELAISLQPGTHVIAVEVHQINTGSSDLVFDMKVETDYSSLSTSVSTPGIANNVSYPNADIPALWLNEVMPTPVSGLPWVEIHNSGSTSLSLDGYSLSDDYGNLDKWPISSGITIPSGGFQQVQLGVGTLTSGSISLSRDVSGSPELIDYLNYGTVSVNWSYGNYPDGDPTSREAMYQATPGAANSNQSAPLDARINEWMADNSLTLADSVDGDFEDWFEIYNPTGSPIDLAGFFLTDDLLDPYQFEIPNNGKYVIPAGGYLIVWADNEEVDNDVDATDLHVNFALSKSGESIALVASDGNIINSVTFGAQATDVSQGRMFDGGSAITVMTPSTPGASNQALNTAPVLTTISDVTLYAGETIVFSAQATDAESAYQTLTFSLDSGAPSGATVTSNGTFSWASPQGAAAGQYSATIRVTDNGSPVLDDSEMFTLHVEAIPQIDGGVTISGDSFGLGVDSLIGYDYQLHYKNSLMDATWLPSGAAVAGTGGRLEWTDLLENSPTRFYKLFITRQ
ncbi:MAG: lamin tail domain-containing protein [Opitutaceae bacterium]